MVLIIGNRMRFRDSAWSGAFLATVAAVVLASGSSATAGTIPLATYHANNARTGYSTGASVTTTNASNLSQRWRIAVSASISDQPIVDNGMIYWGDWNGRMHATSPSGRSRW